MDGERGGRKRPIDVEGLDRDRVRTGFIGAVPDQLHVPLVRPTWLTLPPPESTLIVTASSTSEKVPALPTTVNSGAVTDASWPTR